MCVYGGRGWFGERKVNSTILKENIHSLFSVVTTLDSDTENVSFGFVSPNAHSCHSDKSHCHI